MAHGARLFSHAVDDRSTKTIHHLQSTIHQTLPVLRNYLRVALRALRRQKGYAAINVFGLTVGLACCVLIALYVQDELSYDSFHESASEIIVMATQSSSGGESRRDLETPYPLADALKREVPGVKQAVRTTRVESGEVKRKSQQTYTEEQGVFHAGESFFEMLFFPLVKGRAALGEPGTAVISKAMAEKYFPDENPVGQTLRVKKQSEEEHTYRVTGVARVPSKTFFNFGAVLSLPTMGYAESHADDWVQRRVLTLARLEEGISAKALEKRLAALTEQRYERLPDRYQYTFFTQPLPGLYLSDLVSVEGFRGEQRYLYIFGAVALFILLLACVNYVNLSTARAARRAKEVGVRRAMGAGRFQVARQFLGESVLMTGAAFALSLALARAALPVFNHLTGKGLSLFSAGAEFMLLLFGATLVVGLAAGAYPAVYLSGFRPTDVLRGGGERGRSAAWLRKGLVAFQFAVAVALIAATGVVYQQLRYTQTKDLGFEKEQVVTVEELPDGKGKALWREVLSHPAVRSASVVTAVPGQGVSDWVTVPANTSPQERTEEKSILIKPVVVDSNFVRTMGLRLAAGHGVSLERSSEAETAFFLNETAARRLGWTPEEAVGKPLSVAGTDGQVSGIIEDFHFASLRKEIDPVVMSLDSYERVFLSDLLAVRFEPGRTEAVLDHLQEQWAQFSAEPLGYTFLDREFAEMYRTERRLGRVFIAFASVAVLIACLGLYGLAAFAAERRSKEIAIRKTFGASTWQIVGLLSKQFLVLVAVGFAVAVPVAWWAMQRWLQDFAYHIDVGLWLFAAAGLVALVVAMGATSWQALRAARANPADALRDE